MKTIVRTLLIVLALVVNVAGVASAWAPEPRPLSGPCIPGGAYDTACDVDHDGDVDISDIQLTAGHWNQSGAYISDSWLLAGNAGTTPGTSFLGTTDNQALELRVNGQLAMRLEPASDGTSVIPNILGGTGNSGWGYGNTIGGGQGNNANQSYSTIGGGQGNYANQSYTTVGGGLRNDAHRIGATVGGGESNMAGYNYSTVGGGQNNYAAWYGTVAGGANNHTDTFFATVGGGSSNSANGYASIVGGGISNRADGSGSTIGGGQSNTASGWSSTVAGGQQNQATATYATIGGGGQADPSNAATANRVTDNYGTVAGGGNNQAGDNAGTTVDQPYATVSGGMSNTASGPYATVSGGSGNDAIWEGATVSGGVENLASYLASTVGGGNHNQAGGHSATVAGGQHNIATGYDATISGGIDNIASGLYATVPGGTNNEAQGGSSFAAGSRAKALHNGAFVWADDTASDFVSPADNTFSVRANQGSTFYANTGSHGMLVQNDGMGQAFQAQSSSSLGPPWTAVQAWNNGTSPALYANTTAGTYSAYFEDDIYVVGNCVGCTLVFVARNDSAASLEPGDLVMPVGIADALTGTETPVLGVGPAEADKAAMGVVQNRGRGSAI